MVCRENVRGGGEVNGKNVPENCGALQREMSENTQPRESGSNSRIKLEICVGILC